MTKYKYLIVGGGMTADAAAKGIRAVDTLGSIGIISSETRPPYNRPPLSKGLWKGLGMDAIWRGTQNYFLKLHLGRTVQSLDAAKKQLTDDQGDAYTYEKLLLATGATPRKLPFGSQHIIYYRTVHDYQTLRRLADKGGRFAVIGAGFIGSEIAAALRMKDKEVVMLFPGEGIGSRVFPPDLSKYITDYYRDKGVEMIAGQRVGGLKKRGNELALSIQGGKEVTVNHVVAGIGVIPNIELGEQVGLEIDNGIVVDDHLRTSENDIYAAGDVASFYSPTLEKRRRVEHEDNANMMGRIAGLNMAGEVTPYHYLPCFYSDLFNLSYEAVGDLDSRFEAVFDWKKPFEKGVIYYLDNERVRGVLFWNIRGALGAARKLIADPGPFKPKDLKGRL
ncbi:MAG: FAD-dependent oxidoreductase [Chloroflexi bacterium]|nr:FAD-dependent oxidoreductase [Chloroflexota bacterium]